MSTERYFESIGSGDVETLQTLLNDEPNLREALTHPAYAPERQLGCTGLHAAVYAGQLEATQILLDAGTDIEARTTEGRTALHDSIEFGQMKIRDLLLERGAEVDICSAAILGRVERVRELLDREPRLVNDRSTGLSPLGWASYGDQAEVAGELLDRGARMDDGELLCAASVGHVSVGRLLIERGADPNQLHPGCGMNALHAAAAMQYTHDSRPFIKMLLERAADIGAQAADGRTAVGIAEAKDREQAVEAPEHPRAFAAVAALLRGHPDG